MFADLVLLHRALNVLVRYVCEHICVFMLRFATSGYEVAREFQSPHAGLYSQQQEYFSSHPLLSSVGSGSGQVVVVVVFDILGVCNGTLLSF